MVTLTIDGAEVKAREGEKVLWAALDAGIYIPNLCAIRRAAEPFAGCRLCFVEVEGWREPVTACTLPVAEGMVVHTTTPRVERLRRTAAELLIAADPGDCARCAKNRRCELQQLAARLGLKLKPQRLRRTPRSIPVDSSNPFFVRDLNRCVLCGKCVWACNEWQGIGAIDFALRGFDTEIRPFGGGPVINSRCTTCGECVAICPTGALVPKETRCPTSEVKTICPYCSVGCGIYLGVERGEVVSVRGDEGSPVNLGSLCVKGRFGVAGFVHHPQRLTAPLVRRGGRLEEASWDEALSLVAENLARYRGSEFGLVSSGKCTNEDSYVLQKLARLALDSNNIDQPSRLCDAPSLVALRHSFGQGGMSNPIADIENAACIFVIGSNTTASHPIVGQWVRRTVAAGAKLIVANPRWTQLCEIADLWLRLRPGSDLALLMGMMRVILDEGLADSEFIAARCENFDAFRNSVDGFDLALMEKVSGVSQELVAEAARVYATSKPATILYSSGVTQHSPGVDNVLALANLALLAGNVGRAGGGLNPLQGHNNSQGACDMGVLPDFYPGYQPLADAAIREEFEAAWGQALNPSPGLTLGEMLRPGEVKALYIVGADPALMMADTKQVRKALRRLKFLVVQDIFLTETARRADVVLPATTFAEKDGTFTNAERRVQRLRRAIEPLGEARPDWWIACELARRLGARGFDFEGPAQIMQEVSRLVPGYGGISYRRLEEGGLQWPCPAPDHPGTPLLHSTGFAHGKGRFVPLQYQPPQPDGEYPLLLSSERSLYQFGGLSARVSGLVRLGGRGVVEVSPEDAARLELSDGDRVQVVSPRGEVRGRLRVSRATPGGVVYLGPPSGPMATNLLTSSELDARAKVPGLKLCAVRLEKEHRAR